MKFDIRRLDYKKQYLYKKWHELDMKQGVLIKKLVKTLDVHQR